MCRGEGSTRTRPARRSAPAVARATRPTATAAEPAPTGRTRMPEDQTTVVSPAHRSESPELGRGVPAIRVEGVAKRFGETQALAGVDLEVPEGARFGLLGPNGAGKTPLVRILSTLVPPDSGRAEILGHDVAEEPAAIREQIALTGQFAAIDELLTGRENSEMFGLLLALSRKESAENADRLLH